MVACPVLFPGKVRYYFAGFDFGADGTCSYFGMKLLSDDFDEHPFPSVSVEFAVEDLFPGAEMQFAFRYGDDCLASHDLAFVVGIAVVFAGTVMLITADWFMRGKFFEPALVVLVQSRLVVVDENRCSDMHGIDEAESLLYAAFPERILDVTGDVHKAHPRRDVHPEFPVVRFHGE